MKLINEAQKSEIGILAMLRDLVPDRTITLREALVIAELQANRLIDYFQITCPSTPDEIIREIPHVLITYDSNMPVSGATFWNGHNWIISLNSNESYLRHRFSTMHEFKHILDHTKRIYLYPNHFDRSSNYMPERIADYFAACVLMPKKWVKRLWCDGCQVIGELAQKFEVSNQAMKFRIDELDLTDSPKRCKSHYFRQVNTQYTTKLGALL